MTFERSTEFVLSIFDGCPLEDIVSDIGTGNFIYDGDVVPLG